MIKLRYLISEIIAERLSYSDLMRSSDPKRKDRSHRIPARSLKVFSENDKEAWKFSYKTPRDENTTGLRHQGFIYFFKDSITPGDNALTLDCSVDCGCPDYKYRWAYNNAQSDAGEIGSNSANKNNGTPPQINLGIGLCKHLLSLKEYLRTKIESEPSTTDNSDSVKKPIVVPKNPPSTSIPSDDSDQSDFDSDVDSDVPTSDDNSNIDDPTQSPDQTDNTHLQTFKTTTPNDPTQAPDTATDVDITEPDQTDDPNSVDTKHKLKETVNKNKIETCLNNLCNNHRIFIV